MHQTVLNFQFLGQTALHLSITYGDTEMTSLLLKGGANVDSVDYDGISACHIACKDGMIDHVGFLDWKSYVSVLWDPIF